MESLRDIQQSLSRVNRTEIDVIIVDYVDTIKSLGNSATKSKDSFLKVSHMLRYLRIRNNRRVKIRKIFNE